MTVVVKPDAPTRARSIPRIVTLDAKLLDWPTGEKMSALPVAAATRAELMFVPLISRWASKPLPAVAAALSIAPPVTLWPDDRTTVLPTTLAAPATLKPRLLPLATSIVIAAFLGTATR